MRGRVLVAGVAVDQHADDARQRARAWRSRARTAAARGSKPMLRAATRRELGVEVVGEREDAAHDVARARARCAPSSRASAPRWRRGSPRGSLRSTVVAPRRANRRIGAPSATSCRPARAVAWRRGAVSCATSAPRAAAGARPARARRRARSGPNATRSSARTRMPDRLAHPPHLALAALVDRRARARRAEPAHPRGRGAPVLELDPLAQRPQRPLARPASPATCAR